MPNTTQRRGKSVLVVEDDPVSRCALEKLLSQLGYDTVAVATVAEAMAKLDDQARAILDFTLPDGVGTMVLERIRRENRPIRVVIISGQRDKRLVDDANRLHAELVMGKPINVNALLGWLNDDIQSR